MSGRRSIILVKMLFIWFDVLGQCSFGTHHRVVVRLEFMQPV